MLHGRSSKRIAKREAIDAGERCRYCNVALTDQNITVDHLIPESMGGATDDSNLRLCCERCNILKGNRTAIEFRRLPEVTDRPRTKRLTILVPEFATLDKQAERLGVTTPHLIQMILKRSAKVMKRRVSTSTARGDTVLQRRVSVDPE